MAGLIQQCWDVPPEVTRQVSEPLAAMADRYLPETAKRTAEIGLDPMAVLIGMWRILEHCKANEERVLAACLAERRSAEREETSGAAETTMTDPAETLQQAMSFDAIPVASG